MVSVETSPSFSLAVCARGYEAMLVEWISESHGGVSPCTERSGVMPNVAISDDLHVLKFITIHPTSARAGLDTEQHQNKMRCRSNFVVFSLWFWGVHVQRLTVK